tara:strand:- start:5716 stop:6303 length:588 start_codon:yes stop_codon:yes gene_type:complete
MTDITNILYWIATGLLIPIIALLLFSFIKSLLLLGGFFGMFINRLKYKKTEKDILDIIHTDLAKINELKALKGNKLFSTHLKRISAAELNEVVSEKALNDYEISAEKELSSSKSLARLGPILGLMGTLIPMGPALVGLAEGDIASMAQNMQVAFSTTVVGLFAGGVGYVTQLVKQRWFIEDLNNLEFIHKLTLKN